MQLPRLSAALATPVLGLHAFKIAAVPSRSFLLSYARYTLSSSLKLCYTCHSHIPVDSCCLKIYSSLPSYFLNFSHLSDRNPLSYPRSSAAMLHSLCTVSLLLLSLLNAPVAAQKTCNGYAELCSKRYDEVTSIGAHNSYAVSTTSSR